MTVTTTVLSFPEQEHKEISRRPETFDWIFGIFLVCFVFYSNIIGRKTQVLSSMFSELFSIKKDKSIFSETTTGEWGSRLFLCFQTCLLLAVFLYKYFSKGSDIIPDFPMETIIFVLLLTFILCFFFILKLAMYCVVGLVFFDKDSLKIWIGNFISLLAFLGIFLFIPILLYFYVDTLHKFFFFFILASLIIFQILVIYKLIVLFFHKQRSLLHLFLYLCAQEIIPLFFLWEILGRVFNKFVENSALWL